jgi:hypothetical protein
MIEHLVRYENPCSLTSKKANEKIRTDILNSGRIFDELLLTLLPKMEGSVIILKDRKQ